ncbi:MAG TPA: response regulator transcription factor [Candidatus Coproplasma stercoripullorum]|uniref:Stage 0 sporulation protein A homolog n=1 Tax=Candidatus Coproplasma stercoripullorum TaxID=2840751 RepID=A0A9D1AFB6_9FIRM|nr:response regulator transcription factor [Candidatus Coproplasma stercoripullorum]
MINVAIVDDNSKDISRLQECLKLYGEEKGINFSIKTFSNGVDFLTRFRPEYDIVFLDVDMPDMNGFRTAEKLREMDTDVVLVFVTNLAQYAIEGYKYDAIDYVVKPLKYYPFAMKMKKVVQRCSDRRENAIFVATATGQARLPVQDIYYIEINLHEIIYHTDHGEYYARGTLKKVEEQLPKSEFCRCNSCYIVNLRHVNNVDGNTVAVGNFKLALSRPKKKLFVDALRAFYEMRR